MSKIIGNATFSDVVATVNAAVKRLDFPTDGSIDKRDILRAAVEIYVELIKEGVMNRKMMKDEEVLRAVECCGTEQCSECPYDGDCCGDNVEENYLAEDVKRVITRAKGEARKYRNQAKSQAMEITRLIEMNKALKKRLKKDEVSRSELMVALDCCSSDSVRECVKCPYFDVRDCTMRLLARAKKEIESLESRIDKV